MGKAKTWCRLLPRLSPARNRQFQIQAIAVNSHRGQEWLYNRVHLEDEFRIRGKEGRYTKLSFTMENELRKGGNFTRRHENVKWIPFGSLPQNSSSPGFVLQRGSRKQKWKYFWHELRAKRRGRWWEWLLKFHISTSAFNYTYVKSFYYLTKPIQGIRLLSDALKCH